MSYTRIAVLGVLLLGSVIGAAQTVIRIAPRAGASRCGWSCPGARICLGWRIPEMERHRVCVGGRKVGSSTACRRYLDSAPLRSKRKRVGVS